MVIGRLTHGLIQIGGVKECDSMTWWVGAVLVILAVGVTVSLAFQVVTAGELKRLMQWDQAVQLPDVDGFGDWEMRLLLLQAARLEFPDKKTLPGRVGRRRSFSRRAMANFLGRYRYESLRDSLARQGYLDLRGERCSVRWTSKGRRLLYQVLAGRFGDIGYKDRAIEQWADRDEQGTLYKVDLGD